jgi:Tol biopolymer transport system component
MVIDGVAQQPFDSVGLPIFSPDGKHLAYTAMQQGKQWLVLDATAKPWPHDDPRFTPDGKALTYATIKNGKVVLMVDAKQSGAEHSGVSPAIFSADGRRMMFEATIIDFTAAKTPMVIPQNQGVWNPINVPAGTVVKSFMVVDGKPGAAYDLLTENVDLEMAVTPIFSPDGKHLAYAARKLDAKKNNRWLVVEDEQEGPAFDAVFGLAFSPDGNHLAYVAKRDGKWVAIEDGKAGQPFDSATSITDGEMLVSQITFSPDSRHTAYTSVNDGKWSVVADGRPSGGFDFVGPVTFDAGGTLECLAVKDRTIYHLRWTPPQ